MFTAQFLEKVHLQNFRCFCAWLVTVVIFGFGVWLVSFFFFFQTRFGRCSSHRGACLAFGVSENTESLRASMLSFYWSYSLTNSIAVREY